MQAMRLIKSPIKCWQKQTERQINQLTIKQHPALRPQQRQKITSLKIHRTFLHMTTLYSHINYKPQAALKHLAMGHLGPQAQGKPTAPYGH